MPTPGALDPAFVADCPYGPEALLLDAILAVEPDEGRVVARMPTHAHLPLTEHQRVHPERHPRHVNGGLMVHMTGMLGFVHAYYVLGLRHADGWIGYGGRIYDARYTGLAVPPAPLLLELRATKVRRGPKRIFGRYAFRFTQQQRPIFQSEQAAMWLRIEEGDDPEELGA
ncbi:MAG: hypothetical protein AAGH15_14630 [Myxococcota bacterium]